MKKITEAEKAALNTRTLSRQGNVRTLITQLEVKEILLIEPKDWTWKSAVPSQLCRTIERATNRKFVCEKVLSAPGGWTVTRIS
ncbi:MAG: hypothetical protein V4615_13505 [Bacteroidota bacterium]